VLAGRLWLLLAVLAAPLAAQQRIADRLLQPIELRGGEAQDIYLNFGPDDRPDVEVDARLELNGSWPGNGVGLHIVDGASQQLGMRTVLRYVPGGRVLWLRASADRCVPPGSYTAHLELAAVGDERIEPAKTLRLPLNVEVAGDVACARSRAKAILLALPFALSAFVVVSAATYSRPLPLDRLAERLQPLYRETGVLKPYKDSEKVRQQLARTLRFSKRAAAWFRANPVKIGLRRRPYEETLEIWLNGPALEHLVVTPVSPDYAKSCWDNRVGGHIFARFDGRRAISLLVILGQDARIFSLWPEPSASLASGGYLQRLDLVIGPQATARAGWRLHGAQLRLSNRSLTGAAEVRS
jgi:hypothetical protein